MMLSAVVAVLLMNPADSIVPPRLVVTIVKNHPGGGPVPNVPIFVDGKITDLTASSGMRDFLLRQYKPGRKVRLTLVKEGYSVVNTRDLQVTLEETVTTVTLIVCKDDELEKWFAHYVGFPSQDKLLKELQELKRQARADVLKVEALQRQLDRSRVAAEDLVAALVRQEIDPTSEAYGRVLSLARAGRLDESKATLEAEKLSAPMPTVLGQLARTPGWPTVAIAVLRGAIATPEDARRVSGNEQAYAHAVVGLRSDVRKKVLSEIVQPCVEDFSRDEIVRDVCFRLGFSLDDNEPEFVKALATSAVRGSSLGWDWHRTGPDWYPRGLDWGWFLQKCNAEQQEQAAGALMFWSLKRGLDEELAGICAVLRVDRCASTLIGILDDPQWTESVPPEALASVVRVNPSPHVRDKVAALLERRRAQLTIGLGEPAGQTESGADDLAIIEFFSGQLSTNSVERNRTIERIFDEERWIVPLDYPEEFAAMLESYSATLTHQRLVKFLDSGVLDRHGDSVVLPHYLRMMRACAKRIESTEREGLLRVVLDRLEHQKANDGRVVAYVALAVELQPSKAELTGLARVIAAKMRAPNSLWKARAALYPHLDESSKALLLERPCELFSNGGARGVLMQSGPISRISVSERCGGPQRQMSEVIVEAIVGSRNRPPEKWGDIPQHAGGVNTIGHIERAYAWGSRLSPKEISLLRGVVSHVEIPNRALLALYALYRLSPGALTAAEITILGGDLAARDECYLTRVLTIMLNEIGDTAPLEHLRRVIKSMQAKQTSHWRYSRSTESALALDDEGLLLLNAVQRLPAERQKEVLASLAETLPRLESLQAVVRMVEVLRLCQFPMNSQFLIHMLRAPECTGLCRRVVLDGLSSASGDKAARTWTAVAWAESRGMDLSPNRPLKHSDEGRRPFEPLSWVP